MAVDDDDEPDGQCVRHPYPSQKATSLLTQRPMIAYSFSSRYQVSSYNPNSYSPLEPAELLLRHGPDSAAVRLMSGRCSGEGFQSSLSWAMLGVLPSTTGCKKGLALTQVPLGPTQSLVSRFQSIEFKV